MKGLGRSFESLIPTELIDDEFDPTALEDKKESKLKDLKLDEIVRDEEQPRREFSKEALNALAASIKEHGVLQPIVVTLEDGKYKIVAGERRWRAARIAGLERIPAIIRSLDSQNRLELSIIENAQREDLNAIELATAYAKLKTQFNLTPKDIAAKVGKSEQTIQNTLRLLTLPDDVKKTMVKEKLTEGVMRPLVSRDEETIRKVLPKIVKEGWTARKVERYFAGTKKQSSEAAIKLNASRKEEDKLTAKYNIVTKIVGRSLTFKCKNEAELNSLIKRLASFLLVLTLLSAGALLSRSAFADDEAVDVITIHVPASCTVETTSGTGETYNVSMMPAQYRNDIGPTPISVYCNTNDGFSIYAIGYSNNEYGNTKMLTSDPTVYFDTGTNTSGTPSSWAMKLEAVTGSGTGVYTPTVVSPFSNFSNVPSSYAKVATITSTVTATAEASLNAYYAIYIAPTQNAGNYTGKVRYTIVNPSSEVAQQPYVTEAGEICYYPNGSNVLGSMGCQTIESSDTSATLLASNLSRDGYGFAGWSTTHDYSDSTGFYGPQEYIEFTAGTYTGQNNGLSLYAHWIKSAGSLQDWNGCSSLQADAVTALTDQRDNETYAVAKLADGKCWMIENMRLENTATDNLSGALAQGYETGFTGLADPEGLALFAGITTANSLYSIDGSTTNTISGTYQGDRFPRYNNVNTPTALNVTDRPSNPTTNYATNSTSNAGMYSYGNYYTWPAAAANTTETSTGDYNTKSICPKGWSLPRGGNKSREATNDFWSLVVTGLNGGTKPANYDSQTQPYYTGSTEGTPVSNALRAYPNNFVYSGYINGGSISRGSFGFYWSSTANDSGGAYNLYFVGTMAYPGTFSDQKYFGRSIRCIVPSV